MEHKEFCLRSEDGKRIFAQSWQPEGEIKAAVCLVHGLGEHSSRYIDLATALTNAGYSVITFDHRGHGKSDGIRGHISNYNSFMSDIDNLVNECTIKFTTKKKFLYGHSMGGNLVLNYALKNSDKNLAGVIATGSWLKLIKNPSPFMNSVANVLNKLLPALRVFHSVKNSDITQPVKVNEIDYQKDELKHRWISVRTYVNLRNASAWAMENAHKFKFPLLLLHGGADKVTSPEGSKEFSKLVPSECTFKIYPGLYHEIHRDIGKEEVFSDVINWLNKQLES